MTLERYAGPIRGLRVDQIGTEDILGILRPHWQERPETAGRPRGRLELVLDTTRAAGHRAGENPAGWRGHLDKLLPKRQELTRRHHKAIPYKEAPEFMAFLRMEQSSAARLLEFIALTATRYSEAAEAVWDEFDGEVWTIPGARMNSGREHRVSLSGRALQIMAERSELRSGDLVFPGARSGRPISGTGLAKIIKRFGWDATVHGTRYCFRDWARTPQISHVRSQNRHWLM